jgi:nucleotidyltransferase substrate binding protein (TIGR01987 family)
MAEREELKELRWRQRYQNLLRAYALFDEGVMAKNLNRLEKEGLIQRFEYTFELSWKTMKDYLEARGIDANYPRDVIKEAFASGLVGSGEVWMEMLERRNLLSHTYDEKSFEMAFELVKGSFYSAIEDLVRKLESEK